MMPLATEAAVRALLEDTCRLLAPPAGGWRVHGADAVRLACQVDEAQRKARDALGLTGNDHYGGTG